MGARTFVEKRKAGRFYEQLRGAGGDVVFMTHGPDLHEVTWCSHTPQWAIDEMSTPIE